jgi:hypothetical protein
MNRQQRRRLERRQVEPPDTLTEYLKQPDVSVKRKDLLGVVDKLIRLHILKRKRDKWWRKVRRWFDA